MKKSQPEQRKITLTKKSVRTLGKAVRKLDENELANAVGGRFNVDPSIHCY
jgi:hypothetical protein